MESVEDIVIVGAGISGLAACLGLHRLGIRSFVLEASEGLRTTGYAFTVWANAWRALDALGIADVLRAKYHKLSGFATTSVSSGITTSEMPFSVVDPKGDLECRCVNRKVLLETIENELPRGSIRYSSKVVHIDIDGSYKSLHLADGSLLKTKVLIGCDGVNSVVAKILGFKTPAFAGRSAFRGFVNFEEGHGLEPKFMEFLGNGVKYGVMPVDDHSVYWFFTFTPSTQDTEMEVDPSKSKQVLLDKLGNIPNEIRKIFEKTEVENMVGAALRFRHPWELIWGNITKHNICVLGDALHPMTPDLGQGGCSALEDAVVLARVLGEALRVRAGGDEHHRIRIGMEKFGRERRWRSFDLITSSYFVGFMQQSNGAVMHFLRDKLMANFVAGLVLSKTRFDCANLAYVS